MIFEFLRQQICRIMYTFRQNISFGPETCDIGPKVLRKVYVIFQDLSRRAHIGPNPDWAPTRPDSHSVKQGAMIQDILVTGSVFWCFNVCLFQYISFLHFLVLVCLLSLHFLTYIPFRKAKVEIQFEENINMSTCGPIEIHPGPYLQDIFQWVPREFH